MKSKKLILLSLFLGTSFFPVMAQEVPPATIDIQTVATLQLPADEIIFTINLSATEPTAQRAYDQHKTLERNLLPLLERFQVPDSLVTYSLMNIGRDYRGRDERPHFRTNQQVRIKITDIQQYEPVQIALLSGGIYDFNATFSSSQYAKARVEAPLKGLEQATQEAERLAHQLGRTLGAVLKVSTQQNQSPVFRGEALMVARSADALTEIQQFVQYSASISVTFALAEDE